MTRQAPSLLIITLLILTACGSGDVPTSSGNPGAQFVTTEIFTFAATVDPKTLKQEQDIILFDSFDQKREEIYVIETREQLEALNKTLSPNEQIILDNLPARSYFLVRAPACPDFLEYARHRYEDGRLTIVLHHFTDDSTACLAVLVESYYVYSAYK